MIMKRRIRFTALITAFTAVILCVCAYAKTDIPSPTERFFINDYADVIDAETENYIFEKGKAYNSNGGPQVAVLTVNDIGSSSVEDFGIETAREWGIGSKDADNGVLVLLVTDSRDIRIEVGYGLEGVLNDGKCGRFIRNAVPFLSAGDYSGGIRSIYDDIIGELEEPTPDDDVNKGDIGDIIAAFITAGMLIAIWIIASRRGGGHYRGGRFTGGGFGGFGGFGGSGFGGGGFSGGGGGFGGGGASGKF